MGSVLDLSYAAQRHTRLFGRDDFKMDKNFRQ